MIEIGNKKSNIELQFPSFTGSDGGYYKPTVSEDGLLEWIPTSNTMPAVQAVNIKGPQGDKGNNGVYIGTEEPTDVEVWINPQEVPDFVLTIDEVKALGYITEADVDTKITTTKAEIDKELETMESEFDDKIANVEVDLSNYYNKDEIDDKIDAIEGIEGIQGPQGEPGEQGPAGADGYTPIRGTDYWTEEDKSEIVSDVLAAIPAAEGVEV